MSGDAISKRIKWIFVLCMFAGALGIAEMIFNSIHYHHFAGFPLFPLLLQLAETAAIAIAPRAIVKIFFIFMVFNGLTSYSRA